MRAPLLLPLLLLALLAGCDALQCYACREKAPISDVKLAADIKARLDAFPPCQEFSVGDRRFKQTCSASDRSCLFLTDPNDPENMMRTCFPLARDECKNKACYCTEDLCNAGAGTAWASAPLLVAALAAMLLR